MLPHLLRRYRNAKSMAWRRCSRNPTPSCRERHLNTRDIHMNDQSPQPQPRTPAGDVGHLAARMSWFEPSASLAATQRARELAAAGVDVISLSTGEPDFETPENIREAARRAIANGETRYTNVDGTDALKAAIIEKFKRENGLDYTKKQVIAGVGAKQLIFNAIMATVAEGDEVIVPTPCWVSYPDIVKLMGGVPVPLPCADTNLFKLTPQQLEMAITPRTRWLILNSPNNPSGAVYSEEELRTLGKVLLRHPRVLIMTDDIYEHLLYEGDSFSTIAATVPGLRDRVLTINGVSKAHCMTGWRIGFAGGPEQLIAAMKSLQSQSTTNPCSIAQAAAVEALSGPQTHIEKHNAQFRSRRDLIVRELDAIDGLSCVTPRGAFYAYPSCAGLIGKRTPSGSVIANDIEFSNHLLESQGVAVVAGSPYGLSPHFRISFAVSEATLREAIRRIRMACEELN